MSDNPLIGRGRGAILKQLLEQRQQQAAPPASSCVSSLSSGTGGHDVSAAANVTAATLASTTITTDSGLGDRLNNTATTSGSSGHSPAVSATASLFSSSGRGRLLSQFRSLGAASVTSVQSSVASTNAPLRAAAGRGQLVALMQAMRTAETPPPQPQLQHPIQSGSGDTYFAAKPVAGQLPQLPTGSELAKKLPSAVAAATASPDDSGPPLEPPIRHCRGTKGRAVRVATNYIRLHTDPSRGIHEYEVTYEPNIHANNLRHALLNQHRDGLIGPTKTFDGTTLYLPHRLPDAVTLLQSRNPNDETAVTVGLHFRRTKRIADCLHLYNVLFDRIMNQMNYVRFGRKRFDPSAPAVIPQHKLEVWPGYVTAVDEYEDGVMLCLDVSHRVLCQRTVLDLMREATRSAGPGGFQVAVQQALIGAVVLTRYNNRTYRIDEIQFDATPMDTFSVGGKDITYVEYYKSHYNLTIRDTKQPLLIHTEDRVIVGKAEKERVMFCLIPELCNLTGLTDTMRGDFRLMRDVATITRVTPNQRMAALRKYCAELNANDATRAVLEGWGLRLAEEPLQLEARQLEEEKIQFGGGAQFGAGVGADFGKYATSKEAFSVVALTTWLVMYTRQDQKTAEKFVECMQRNSRPMGITVSPPRLEMLADDKTEVWVRALRKCVDVAPKVQIVVLICPTSRDDRYAAIKKVCCAELPIPSQVINSRTLANDAKNRAIVQKIALQMNCKMGGSLWAVRIPMVNVMICGVDTYHDAAHKADSVAAMVASLNGTYTEWYSKAILQRSKEELGNGLCAALTDALGAYQKRNRQLPDKVILYRDGVGDGQLRMCEEYEVPQIMEAFAKFEEGYAPLLTFVVVQKRINTRVFAMQGSRGSLDDLQNPQPGCVLDNTITRRHLYDFFLVPQSVRQGTVSPTHYIVVHDTAQFTPDVLQRLSYKLCFLYYNWPGTVRVPACCQYAHKLAFLVGQSVRRPTAEILATKLFYL